MRRREEDTGSERLPQCLTKTREQTPKVEPCERRLFRKVSNAELCVERTESGPESKCFGLGKRKSKYSNGKAFYRLRPALACSDDLPFLDKSPEACASV